jgi:hypothetical protein
MDAADVWVAKDDETEIIRTREIDPAGRGSTYF